MKRELSCGAVIFRERSGNTEFLLIRHKGPNGHWDFPKGHIEKGETEIEAARREVGEETGLEIEFIEGFKAENKYESRKGVMKTVVLFLAKAMTETVVLQEKELDDYAWLGYDAAAKQLTYDNARMVLSKAKEFLKKPF
jgi:8-oxo-dGTP pyrophosphatase MutT (NUDIX family)